MKILFVTPPPYLPNRLHRNRSFDLIRILAKNHEVHLFCLTTQKEIPQEFSEIKKVCKSVKIIYQNPIKAILNCLRFPFLPSEVAYCYSEKAIEAMRKILQRENIDIVYLKRLRSAIYLGFLAPSDDCARNDRIILDSTDSMSMFYSRLSKLSNFPQKIIYKLEEIKYKMFEKKTMKKIKNWIVCSSVDQKYLQNLGRDVNVHLVQNPVDVDYFSPRSWNGRSTTENGEFRNSLLLRGLMDKPVNIDACLFFVKEILPKVRQNIKDVKLFIVGPKPHKSIQKLHNAKNVFVTGFVKDIRKYIKETNLAICPVRIASGTRFKILQAWSMGRPIVSTTIGAEGLFYKNDYNIAIANTPSEFAEKIIRLLQNKKYYSKLQRNGLKSVQADHSFKTVEQQLERVFRYVNFYPFNR